MIGWGQGDDWDKAYAFFVKGNTWTYEELLKSLNNFLLPIASIWPVFRLTIRLHCVSLLITVSKPDTNCITKEHLRTSASL